MISLILKLLGLTKEEGDVKLGRSEDVPACLFGGEKFCLDRSTEARVFRVTVNSLSRFASRAVVNTTGRRPFGFQAMSSRAEGT